MKYGEYIMYNPLMIVNTSLHLNKCIEFSMSTFADFFGREKDPAHLLVSLGVCHSECQQMVEDIKSNRGSVSAVLSRVLTCSCSALPPVSDSTEPRSRSPRPPPLRLG